LSYSFVLWVIVIVIVTPAAKPAKSSSAHCQRLSGGFRLSELSSVDVEALDAFALNSSFLISNVSTKR